MTDAGPLALDAVIFGGGAAGLWLLDELVRRERRVVLLESGALGRGQTVGSQGIIHGGMKYSLGGLPTPSGRAIRDMPVRWRRCLAGEAAPNLSRTRLRSEFCYLWQTDRLRSRIGMAGARVALQITPAPLADDARPGPLAGCPGDVCRLDEQVIDPPSFLCDLFEQHRGRILHMPAEGVGFETDGPGQVRLVRVTGPDGETVDLQPRHVVLTAGGGNAALRSRLGLEPESMQRRPLQMVMLRGELPLLNGHCVDGGRTRLTVTSTRDCAERVVWQLGGQLAEDGETLDPDALIRHARHELRVCVPGADVAHAEWATYRAERAEGRTRGGRRPRTAQVSLTGNTFTGWPTKLALVPILAEKIVRAMRLPRVGATTVDGSAGPDTLRHWPRPAVALPPWEANEQWTHVR